MTALSPSENDRGARSVRPSESAFDLDADWCRNRAAAAERLCSTYGVTCDFYPLGEPPRTTSELERRRELEIQPI